MTWVGESTRDYCRLCRVIKRAFPNSDIDFTYHFEWETVTILQYEYNVSECNYGYASVYYHLDAFNAYRLIDCICFVSGENASRFVVISFVHQPITRYVLSAMRTSPLYIDWCSNKYKKKRMNDKSSDIVSIVLALSFRQRQF